MTLLALDYETRSPVDIKLAGLKPYAAKAEIVLAAWQVDNGAMQQWDLFEGKGPNTELVELLRDPSVEKRAFNAAFEIEISRVCSGVEPTPLEWVCTMAWAYARAFKGAMADVSRQIGLPDDKQKRTDGTRLITKFCCPPYADPMEHTDDWERFRDYNRQDVVAESAIADYLAPFPLTSEERDTWAWDYAVNNRGIPVDTEACLEAIDLAEREAEYLLDQIRSLTGLSNPNSRDQLLRWLRSKGYPYADLQKATVERAVKDQSPYQRVLQLRLMVAKASTKKFIRLVDSAIDGRVHNTLQFCAAGRTGRWGGRGLQLQNLMRPTIPNPEQVADLLHDGYSDLVEVLYG